FTVVSPRRRFSRLIVNSSGRTGEDPLPPVLSSSSAFAVLGVDPNCSSAELKAAFRAKVKQYHPDVNKGGGDSDTMIRRVIQSYEILSNYSRSEIIERECLDPFYHPESEAFDVFINETVLKTSVGCPYSCVKRAPHALAYDPSTGTACATSQGHNEDYQVQLAVGQCPRSCIHFVTPSQRIILEELLDSILGVPFDISAEADLLYSLIVKARFENNRYQSHVQPTMFLLEPMTVQHIIYAHMASIVSCAILWREVAEQKNMSATYSCTSIGIIRFSKRI
ncbi:uncharacterized protein LOC120202348, partial [Hibiscus syriacus]|uniref:uncharacterized protein LOC120202348 n=1 Tax=Hibiscus syriacus TaxID=106335 RepID=UPI001922AC77